MDINFPEYVGKNRQGSSISGTCFIADLSIATLSMKHAADFCLIVSYV